MIFTSSAVDWTSLEPYIQALIQAGLATRTFRRLDANRQHAVLQALLDEAAEHGPGVLNVHFVARRAGVAVGSLYQYFGEREQMIAFILELCRRYCLDTFAQARPYLLEMPLRDALEMYLSYGVEWSMSQAGLMRLFARAAYTGGGEPTERLVTPIADAMRGVILDLLRAGIERGEVRREIDLDATARLVHALLAAVGDAQMLPHLNAYYQVVFIKDRSGISSAPKDEIHADTWEVSPERSRKAVLDLIMHGISPST